MNMQMLALIVDGIFILDGDYTIAIPFRRLVSVVMMGKAPFCEVLLALEPGPAYLWCGGWVALAVALSHIGILSFSTGEHTEVAAFECHRPMTQSTSNCMAQLRQLLHTASRVQFVHVVSLPGLLCSTSMRTAPPQLQGCLHAPASSQHPMNTDTLRYDTIPSWLLCRGGSASYHQAAMASSLALRLQCLGSLALSACHYPGVEGVVAGLPQPCSQSLHPACRLPDLANGHRICSLLGLPLLYRCAIAYAAVQCVSAAV